jgi:hypothetical protein
MIANVLLITIAILLALGFWLMGALRFLVPYKLVLWRAYATPILIYMGLLSTNAFAAVFVFIRKFFLKDTGRKLSHFDKQLHMGQAEIPASWPGEESE